MKVKVGQRVKYRETILTIHEDKPSETSYTEYTGTVTEIWRYKSGQPRMIMVKPDTRSLPCGMGAEGIGPEDILEVLP